MKKLLFCIFALVAFASCQKENELLRGQDSKGDLVKIIGTPIAFDNVNVDTKGAKDELEAEVSNMIFFVLDKDDNIIYRKAEEGDKPVFVLDRPSLKENNPGADLTECKMMIVANVKDLWNNALLNTSSVTELDHINSYVFEIAKILTADDLRAKNSPGLPMSGFYNDNGNYTLNLEPVELGQNDPLKGRVLNISLECLFAKVVFNIRVNPLQSASAVTGEKQSFTLTSWQVFNVPTKLELGEPDVNAETRYANSAVLNSPIKTSASTSVVSEDATKPMTFIFYVPEHKINPGSKADYPWTSEDYNPQDYEKNSSGVEGKYYQYRDYRQYLKPTLVQDNSPTHPAPGDRKAMYVEIKGSYVDHNTKSHDVTYTIYLGANPIDDFYILRNHQYNNNITIKGVKNSVNSHGDWVTYDHRVFVEEDDFSFGLQRETLLDSHWEIRPIRIDFNKAAGSNAVAVVTINDCNWIAIESPSETTISSNRSRYCDASETNVAYGKRRYFTTDLISSLSGTKSLVIRRDKTSDHNIARLDGYDAHTIWVYIDENTAKTKGYRYATMTCKYYKDADTYNNGAGEPTVTEEYIFRQNNLFPVSNNGHDYLIEYYEEYLYNFDTKEDYGNTTDGMKWGLMGDSISDTNGAVAMGNITIDTQGFITGTIRNNVENRWNSQVKNELKDSKKYDFYLPRDVNTIPNGSELTSYDRRGLDFTKKISSSAIDIASLPTNKQPESAIEYCLNKNKRNSDGTISDVKWYLPAIDEIEDITTGGYGEFEVFQDKLYWSSQPSYKKYSVSFIGNYNSTFGTTNGSANASGSYFEDNVDRARATKTKMNGDIRENVTSATNINGDEYIWGTTTYNHSFEVFWYLVGNTIRNENFNSSFAPAEENHIFDEGNCARDEIHRVRCVYAD